MINETTNRGYRRMFRTRVTTALLTGVLAFGLVACGGDDQASDQVSDQGSDQGSRQGSGQGSEQGTGQPREQGTEGDTAAEEDAASPGEAISPDEADEYVTITACTGAPEQSIGVSATIEVTNPLDEPKEYYGSIEFRDASGAVLTDGSFNTGTLEPGASSTEEVPGANVYEAVPGVTCALAEVKADNPA